MDLDFFLSFNSILDQALGEGAFDFKFEGSELLEGLIQGQTPETHPQLFTKHCWDVENRGAVGETTFHVCFLMGTPTHMFCAKRILKWFPEVRLLLLIHGSFTLIY